MAAIRKRAGGWRAEVRKRGVYQSRTFATKVAALAWAEQVETGIEAGRRGELPKKTFADLALRYRDEVSPTKAGARWEALRLARLAEDVPFRHRLCHSISPDEIGTWRNLRLQQVSAATVRRELTLLGAVFETARREWRWVTVNPVRDVRKPVDSPPRRRGISAAEQAAILPALGWSEAGRIETINQQVAAAFLLALETAMRAGELRTLIWPHIDLHRRVAHLPKTKNGQARDVPLSNRAVELLKKLQACRPDRVDQTRVFTFSAATLDAAFRKAKIRAGCREVHFHDARSEALTRLADRLDVLELASMVGHRNPKSLMMYYKKSAAEIAKKLD